ncbi:MAG: polysaccharide biosynthesis C-terminal domain-containing protein [Candidatus Latescibacterota bacterium]
MRFLHGFSLTAGSQALVFSLGLLNQSLLGRFLPAEEFGRLFYWSNTVLFGAMLLGEWASRGATYVVGREGTRAPVVGNALAYSALLGLGVACLALAARWPGLAELLGGEIFLVGCLVALSTMQRTGLGVLLGEERLRAYAAVPLVATAVYLGGSGLLVQAGRCTLENVLAVWGLAIGTSVAAAYGLLVHSCGRLPAPSSGVFGRTARIGARGAISFILIFLLFRSNVWLIKALLGEAPLATYKAASAIGEMMQRLPNIAGAVLLAKVVRGRDEQGRLSLAVGQATLLFSVAVAAGILLLGRPLLALAFPLYPEALAPLAWMLPGLVCAGFGSVFNTKLSGEGFPPITLWAPLVALALNLVLNVLLIRSHGLSGAALATSIALAVWAALVTAAYLRVAGHRWRDLLRFGELGATAWRRLGAQRAH